jgi:hypothetical protein
LVFEKMNIKELKAGKTESMARLMHIKVERNNLIGATGYYNVLAIPH